MLRGVAAYLAGIYMHRPLSLTLGAIISFRSDFKSEFTLARKFQTVSPTSTRYRILFLFFSLSLSLRLLGNILVSPFQFFISFCYENKTDRQKPFRRHMPPNYPMRLLRRCRGFARVCTQSFRDCDALRLAIIPLMRICRAALTSYNQSSAS